MKILILCLLLTSCASATYEVKRCEVTDAIEHCSTAKIKSKREFKDGVVVTYKNGEFTFQSGDVTTKESVLEQAGAQAILKLIDQVTIK